MKLPAKHNNYVSDHTLFIAELKAKNPGMEAGQQAGRALLWDKPAVSIDEQERQLASAVKQQAYVLPEQELRSGTGTMLPEESVVTPEADASGAGAVIESPEPATGGDGSGDPAASASTDAAPAAEPPGVVRLYGEPMLRMPTDLYIPPDALEIFLEAFEGPLDLLLYLIRKQNFNILDIPMAQVTLQYLKYVDQIRVSNLELAAEYLLMAAMLIEIKSRMLLPSRKSDVEEDGGDPRAELVRRLLEYEQIKLAAYDLNTIPQFERDFVRTQIFIEQSLTPTWPDVEPVDLQQAWLDVLKRAKLTQHHRISRQELSVREHMSSILRHLQSSRFVEFSELFDIAGGVPVVVVNFVALLELAKETLIEITQAEPFAPIYVRLAYSPA